MAENPREARARHSQRWGSNLLEALSYFIAFPLLHGLARLPFAALYWLSDVVFFVVYRVLRLRRAVTRDNLRRSFPEAAPDELARIEERCYRNQCDVAFEWLKMMAMRPEEIRERMRANIDVAFALRDRRQSAIFVLGHCGNWEWAIPSAALALAGMTLHVVYHPLRHARFDRLIRTVRGRHGGVVLTPMADATRVIAELRHELTATVLVADQRARSRNAYFTRFLGQETAFLRGPERLARGLGVPVVYGEVIRVSRGRYEMRTEWLCEDPSALPEGEITERFARRLEQQILEAPEDWLWLHRRWRNRRVERGE